MADLELEWHYVEDQMPTTCGPVWIAHTLSSSRVAVVSDGYYIAPGKVTPARWWSDMHGFVDTVYAWAERDAIKPPPTRDVVSTTRYWTADGDLGIDTAPQV